MVGPIMGISGLLLGIAKKRGVKAYCLLSETLGHPIYVGLKGSKAIIQILSGQYGFNINFSKLDKEIKDMDSRISGMEQGKDAASFGKHPDVNYIG
jgi:proteasome assembly chaperone (PAC2) family protein